MTIKLPDARRLSDAALETLRLRAIHAYELGYSEAEIAELLGVARETVSRWWTAYQNDGLPGLPGPRTGRPLGTGRALSDEQAAQIQQLIATKSPGDLGIKAAVWSRRAIRELIFNKFGIYLAVRTVGEYLKRWNHTAKRPSRHCRKQNPKEVATFLSETYPRVKEQAAKEDAQILWCDETGVAADATLQLGYAPRGQRATMEVPPPHIRVNVISALSNTGKLRYMTYKDTMTAERFLVFLRRLVRNSNTKTYLFADRLRAHDASLVYRWLAQHRDRIEMVLMPRYSPELNPTEYLNNDLKGNIHRHGMPASYAQLREQVLRFLRSLSHVPGHVASFFDHPKVCFAAL